MILLAIRINRIEHETEGYLVLTQRASVINPALEQIRILKTAQALNMDSKTIERLYAAFERYAGKQLQMSFTLVLEVLKSNHSTTQNRRTFPLTGVSFKTTLTPNPTL